MRIVLGRFHDFGQLAHHVFGVEKEDGRAVRADARGAEDALAHILESLARVLDILDLVADMVLPAGGVLFEELGDGAGAAERLDQLDLRAVGAALARRVDEADLHPLRLEIEGFVERRRAHDIAVIAHRFLDRGRDDSDVIKTS